MKFMVGIGKQFICDESIFSSPSTKAGNQLVKEVSNLL